MKLKLNMKILLKKATGSSAGEFPKLVTRKWPLGQVTLYQDRIILELLHILFDTQK